ncbi:MAG: protein phosphatase 2C domain-containing protein [Anaerolineae bacterium]
MLSHTILIGRTHRLAQQNGQDFACTGAPRPGFAYGLVLDGCGSKFRAGGRTTPSHNEIGAKLLGQFAARFLNRQMSPSSQPFCLSKLLDGLYRASLHFLQGTAAMIPFPDEEERTRFVATHLLATMVGFMVTPETAAFFWQGDGYLCCNGEVTALESENRPEYLAYQLLRDRDHGRFQTQVIPNRDEATWLAVATDGWQAGLLPELAQPRNSLALQRWVNRQARRRGVFEDDAAAAVWWNKE